MPRGVGVTRRRGLVTFPDAAGPAGADDRPPQPSAKTSDFLPGRPTAGAVTFADQVVNGKCAELLRTGWGHQLEAGRYICICSDGTF